MAWNYLLVFSPTVGSQVRVKTFLNAAPEVLHWSTYMPNTFFIVSNETASGLTKVFERLTKKKGRFLILDTETDRNGWMPKDVWEQMRNPDVVFDR